MRFFQKVKDGGPASTVESYTLIEVKSLFSIMVLKFNPGSRTNFHSHAFNALTWFIKGGMKEEDLSGLEHEYRRSVVPKLTRRSKFHKVIADTTSWCFTIRGPWSKQWYEYNPNTKTYDTLKNGRVILNSEDTNPLQEI